jgi:hypothetical protein
MKHQWRYDHDEPVKKGPGPKVGKKPKPRVRLGRKMPHVTEVRALLSYIDTARREHREELARENAELLKTLAPDVAAELDRRRAEDRAKVEAFTAKEAEFGYSTSSTLARERELARRANEAKLAAAREIISGREFAE